ncbi:hypothetical protein ACVQ90_13275 [Staphylococcus aureus]
MSLYPTKNLEDFYDKEELSRSRV